MLDDCVRMFHEARNVAVIRWANQLEASHLLYERLGSTDLSLLSASATVPVLYNKDSIEEHVYALGH